MPDLSNYFLITDLDGTLLPSNKVLLEKDKEAIRRFRDRGGKFSIATGRTLQAAVPFVEELQLDMPSIMYNGSLIYDGAEEKALYTFELDPSVGKKIALDILNKFDCLGCEVLRLDNIYVVCNNEYERRHIEICRVDAVYTDIESVPDTGWHKILFAGAPEDIDRLQSYVEKHSFPVDFVRSEAHYFEILPKGSSKGTALKEYIRLMGLENTHVIAAGDFNNDIEMLEAADTGACPNNAQEDVKAAADVVLSETSENGAIAELIGMIEDGRIK